MPFYETKDGIHLHYNDWGSGKPVVLVHGWPLSADMWEYQSVFLAQNGFRVVTYDRRGFGRSAQPWDGYDYDTMADDLAGLIEKLDLRDVGLVGFSMGGGEVARYAGRHGTERLSHAALVAAVTPYLLKDASNPDGVDREVFDQIVEGLKKDRPGFLASFGKQFYGAGLLNFSISSEFLQWSQNLAMLASPKATIDCVRAFSEADFRADLPKLQVPTLIVHGDADATVPLAVAAEKAAKLVPHADLRVYKGAPHGLFYTERDRLNTDLLGFLRN